jgi:hypothetical protein
MTWVASSTAPDDATTVKAISAAHIAGHHGDRPGVLAGHPGCCDMTTPLVPAMPPYGVRRQLVFWFPTS